MNIRKALQNPFALVAQGFAVGAVLFFATTPRDVDTPQQPSSAQVSAAIDRIGA